MGHDPQTWVMTDGSPTRRRTLARWDTRGVPDGEYIRLLRSPRGGTRGAHDARIANAVPAPTTTQSRRRRPPTANNRRAPPKPSPTVGETPGLVPTATPPPQRRRRRQRGRRHGYPEIRRRRALPDASRPLPPDAACRAARSGAALRPRARRPGGGLSETKRAPPRVAPLLSRRRVAQRVAAYAIDMTQSARAGRRVAGATAQADGVPVHRLPPST